ncbi:MAG TPA: uracil-DNA glycosylase, partial [Cytophagales bacterium]|nr:uracil-DNA glycosylase [Cytophagales bacterium]
MNSCDKCELHESVKNIKIGGRTVGEAKALFVGEAPGESEDNANAVFVGRAGEKLQW